MQGFVSALKLRDIVLVADDWGGPLGMHDVIARSERYQAAILMETFLWTFTFKDDFEPKFRMPFRLMRGPLGVLLRPGAQHDGEKGDPRALRDHR